MREAPISGGSDLLVWIIYDICYMNATYVRRISSVGRCNTGKGERQLLCVKCGGDVGVVSKPVNPVERGASQ